MYASARKNTKSPPIEGRAWKTLLLLLLLSSHKNINSARYPSKEWQSYDDAFGGRS